MCVPIAEPARPQLWLTRRVVSISAAATSCVSPGVIMSNRTTALFAAVLSATLACAPLLAEETKPIAQAPAALQTTPEQRAAADAGLKWLAAQQGDNGALTGMNNQPSAANTAIAGLAFLSAGSTLDAG